MWIAGIVAAAMIIGDDGRMARPDVRGLLPKYMWRTGKHGCEIAS